MLPSFHYHFVHLSAQNFGMCQSRKRVYILMVRKDVASEQQLEGVCKCIGKTLPRVFPCRESLSNVRAFVERVIESKHGQIHLPAKSHVLRQHFLRGPSREVCQVDDLTCGLKWFQSSDFRRFFRTVSVQWFLSGKGLVWWFLSGGFPPGGVWFGDFCRVVSAGMGAF